MDRRIAVSYYDTSSRRCWSPAKSVRAVDQLLRECDAGVSQVIPPCQVVDAGCTELMLTLPIQTDPADWSGIHITAEGGTGHPVEIASVERAIDSSAVRLKWCEPLPPGYATLTFNSQTGSGKSATFEQFLIVAPDRCHCLPAGRQVAALAAQLYALHSDRSWGIGDFSDLRTLCTSVAQAGYDYVMLNPLHLIFFDKIATISPYSPQSRTLLNWVYIDVTAVPGFPQVFTADDEAQLNTLTAAPDGVARAGWIDYPAVANFKRLILRRLVDLYESRSLKSDRPLEALEAFRKHNVTVISALVHAALINRQPDEIAAEISFQVFAQWCCQEQLATCRKSNTGVGIIMDLAIGVASDAAEVRAGRDLFGAGVSLGVPPDSFSADGQLWNLAPFHPGALQKHRYRPLIDLLRANMPVGGGIRIDHVMWILRQFWICDNQQPASGVYVKFPVDELLAIIKVESRRRNCLVIGEDLGTVPRGFRRKIRQAGIYSMTVFRFERDDDGQFRDPGRYPAHSAAFIGTHDMPTLRGFWNSHDIELLAECGRITCDRLDGALYERSVEKAQILDLLDPAKSHDDMVWPDVLQHLRDKIRSSPIALRVDMLDDLLGESLPVNIPGTITEYPNWRRRYGDPLSMIVRGLASSSPECPQALSRSGDGGDPGIWKGRQPG